MERCYFARKIPEIEIKDGLVFIRPVGSDCEVALTPATLEKFILRSKEALAMWQVDQLGTVVEFRGH